MIDKYVLVHNKEIDVDRLILIDANIHNDRCKVCNREINVGHNKNNSTSTH